MRVRLQLLRQSEVSKEWLHVRHEDVRGWLRAES